MRRVSSFMLWSFLTTAAVAQDARDRPTLVLDTGGHTAAVEKVLFTPDGKELISVSDDKTIRVWEADTGAPLRVLRPPIGAGVIGALYAASLSADGHTLAVGGLTPTAADRSPCYLIDLSSSRIERVLSGHTDKIIALAFSSDGRWLASGSLDRKVLIWDIATGRCEHTLEGHEGPVSDLMFSPDSRHLISGSSDKTGRIWSLTDGSLETILRGHQQRVTCVAWRPDGRVVATGSTDYQIKLWDPKGNPYKFSPSRSGMFVMSLTYSSDSQSLLYAWGGWGWGGATLVDSATGKERAEFTLSTGWVKCGTLSPDAKCVAIVSDQNCAIHKCKIDNPSTAISLGGVGQTVFSAAWSPDGKTIAWGNSTEASPQLLSKKLEHTFRLSELASAGAPNNTFRVAERVGDSISLIVGGGYKKTDVAFTEEIEVWPVPRRRESKKLFTLRVPEAHSGFSCYTLIGDDKAASCHNSAISIFDIKLEKRLHRLVGHTDVILAVSPSPDGRFLLSASKDQTLRIWSLDQGGLLLSLFFGGDDWIAWTPQGYYAASPTGEQLVGWHVNNGLNAMASYYPASQFRKTLHRPDVIKRLLKAGSLSKALAEADTARGEASRPTQVAQVLPPKVTITASVEGRRALSTDTLEVQAIASSVGAYPVTALRLLLDGRPAPEGLTTFPNPKLGEARASWTVAVPPGTHRLIVQADSEVSKGLSDPVEIARGGGDAEPGMAKGSGTLYVLAIGINDYPDKRLKLDCAASDARALRQAFLDHSRRLFRGVEARLLLNGEATRAHILEGLGWLSATAKAGDVAVVFYAGHGDSKIENQFYLVPVDANLRDLGHSGISGEDLRKGIGDLPCTIMLLLDACYAGSIDVKKRKTRGLPQPGDAVVRDLVYDSGLVVMCGAWKEQEAAEESGQGFFTRALVEGMEGKADINKDGRVELYELQAYVNLRVRELSSGEQEPTISIPAIVRSFPLSQP